MKTETKPEPRRFELRQLGFNDDYYLSRIVRLEEVLAEEPEQLQIDIVGECGIPADTALLIRSILNQRSPGTQLITNARSSVCGGSALIWLLGDVRMIRDDAKLFFRRIDASELNEVKLDEAWRNPETRFEDPDSEANPAEDEYARVLEHINAFLPVKEMAGRMIGVPVLRQFGLVDNEAMDQLLSSTIGAATQCSKREESISNPLQT
jgi:hypothetical protein